MRIGIDRESFEDHCGGWSVIKTFGDFIKCRLKFKSSKLNALFYQHIHDRVEMIIFDYDGSPKKLYENGTAIQALRLNEIDGIFNSVQLPNINSPLKEQKALSQNLSYAFIHKVDCRKSFVELKVTFCFHLCFLGRSILLLL